MYIVRLFSVWLAVAIFTTPVVVAGTYFIAPSSIHTVSHVFMAATETPLSQIKTFHKGEVLAASTGLSQNLPVNFNVPVVANQDVQVKKNLTVDGTSTFNGDVVIKDKKIDLGNGTVNASNVVYGVTAGNGVSITGGQNPVVNNNGVLSLAGQTGNVNLSAGTGISIDGLKISSTGITSLVAGDGISVDGNKITNTGLSSLTAGTGISVSGSTVTNTDAGSSQNIFKTIAVSGQSNIAASSNSDTLTFAAGSGVTLTTDTTSKTLTIGMNVNQAGVTSVNNVAGALSVVGAGINAVSTSGSTITVTGTEADTLATVTARGANTSTAVSFGGNVDITGLSSGGILKASATTGRLALATGGSDYQVPLSFGNGLVNSVNTVSLGGTLSTDVTLATAGYTLGLTGNGKLGIGTNNPASTLDVQGGIRLGSALGVSDILNTTPGSAPGGALYWGNRAICDSTGNCAGTSSSIGGSGTAGYLSKFSDTYTLASSLLFDDGSHVGIGTALPVTKLDVNGSIGIGGTAVFDSSRHLTNLSGVSTNLVPTTNDTYDLGSNSSEYNNIYGKNIYVSGNIISGGSGGGSGTIGYVQRNNGAIAPANTSDDLLLGSTSTSSATVKLSGTTGATSFINGNLAIGTTSANEKLTVAGNIAPSIDNTYNLGSSNYAWNTVYANNIVGTSFTATSSGTFKDVIISGKTNQITDDTNLANGKDTFVYQVKTDIDGGAWISDEKVQSASWYNETLDHTSTTCSLSTDDRCGARSFPQKSIIVATNTTLYIYDAIDNTMWMKFSRGTGYALNGSSVTINSVFALNGVVYVATSTNGLLALDFINDRIYQYDYNGGSGGRAQFLSTISNRNSNVGYGARQSWGQIASDQVNSVYPRVINGKLYIAVGTLGGASVIDVTDERVVRYIN